MIIKNVRAWGGPVRRSFSRLEAKLTIGFAVLQTSSLGETTAVVDRKRNECIIAWEECGQGVAKPVGDHDYTAFCEWFKHLGLHDLPSMCDGDTLDGETVCARSSAELGDVYLMLGEPRLAVDPRYRRLSTDLARLVADIRTMAAPKLSWKRWFGMAPDIRSSEQANR